ncbi:hypothetical protein ACJX0J_026196, partial [Zea mays]
ILAHSLFLKGDIYNLYMHGGDGDNYYSFIYNAPHFFIISNFNFYFMFIFLVLVLNFCLQNHFMFCFYIYTYRDEFCLFSSHGMLLILTKIDLTTSSLLLYKALSCNMQIDGMVLCLCLTIIIQPVLQISIERLQRHMAEVENESNLEILTCLYALSYVLFSTLFFGHLIMFFVVPNSKIGAFLYVLSDPRGGKDEHNWRYDTTDDITEEIFLLVWTSVLVYNLPKTLKFTYFWRQIREADISRLSFAYIKIMFIYSLLLLFLFFGFKHALKFNIENPIYVIVLSQICLLNMNFIKIVILYGDLITACFNLNIYAKNEELVTARPFLWH